MTKRDRVRFGDATIEYEVRRSQRRKKTVQISVDGGGVKVAAPMTTPDTELRAIVRKRAPWILSHASTATLEPAPKRFVSDEDTAVPWPQRQYGSGVLRTCARRRSASNTGAFVSWRLTASTIRTATSQFATPLLNGIGLAPASGLTAGVDRWLPRLSREDKPRILVRDQRKRWGSCAPDGTLRFNWRVMMLEPALIDYIVVHELAHLTVKNHSADFWELVSKVMPDVQQRRQRLRTVGRALPL